MKKIFTARQSWAAFKKDGLQGGEKEDQDFCDMIYICLENSPHYMDADQRAAKLYSLLFNNRQEIEDGSYIKDFLECLLYSGILMGNNEVCKAIGLPAHGLILQDIENFSEDEVKEVGALVNKIWKARAKKQ